MAVQSVGQLSHRIAMLAVAAQGVMNTKDLPTHVVLVDFANTMGDLAISLKELQKDLEVTSLFHCIVLRCSYQSCFEVRSKPFVSK